MTLVCGFGSVGGPALANNSRYGRFWYFFPHQCIAFNDAAAYFFGKLFGRTKLIGVSPNKTVEGFVGAMFSNIVETWIFASVMTTGAHRDFWICSNFKYSIAPFENYTCDEVHPIFVPQSYQLPFPVFGQTHIDC